MSYYYDGGSMHGSGIDFYERTICGICDNEDCDFDDEVTAAFPDGGTSGHWICPECDWWHDFEAED